VEGYEEDWGEDPQPYEWPEEERLQAEAWMRMPSRGWMIAQSVATLIFALVGAVVIMLQWVVWFAYTSQFFSGWGMILGIGVALAQILTMFNPFAPEEASCKISS
jgi:hypothetical protein